MMKKCLHDSQIGSFVIIPLGFPAQTWLVKRYLWALIIARLSNRRQDTILKRK